MWVSGAPRPANQFTPSPGDNGATSRSIAAAVTESQSAKLAWHRDKKGGRWLVGNVLMPWAVFVVTFYYWRDPDTGLLTMVGDGDVKDDDLIDVCFRGSSKAEDFCISPRHKSLYVMSGAFNAHFQHSLSKCPRTVMTDTGRQLVRVSRVLHAWF